MAIHLYSVGFMCCLSFVINATFILKKVFCLFWCEVLWHVWNFWNTVTLLRFVNHTEFVHCIGGDSIFISFAKSSWFCSWCKQWFCMTVCCSSLLFPMHHFHYFSSKLLSICSAYHQISLSLRSACCAAGSKNISSYFLSLSSKLHLHCFRGFFLFAQKNGTFE